MGVFLGCFLVFFFGVFFGGVFGGVFRGVFFGVSLVVFWKGGRGLVSFFWEGGGVWGGDGVGVVFWERREGVFFVCVFPPLPSKKKTP